MKHSVRAALKSLALLLCLALFLSSAVAEQPEEDLLSTFIVRHGSRTSPKIAITMDDIYEHEYAWKAVELCRQYGITMTFFPIGINIKEEDGDRWRDLVDSGCEIGSHSFNHGYFYGISEHAALARLGRFQQFLDKALGYHYQVRWFRPPYGRIKSKQDNGSAMSRVIRSFGFSNLLLWDVSETDVKKAFKNVQNGSILLFHARQRDYECLETLIPQLLEAGFEPVTVSALFGFDPPETSDELYVFDAGNFSKPE